MKFTIKQIFQDNWLDFLNTHLNIRSVVNKEVNKMINCQDPSLGHALYFCDNCGKFKCVPFTCKSRFCNSCGIKYQKDRANSIESKLINCQHRHIVFTIPFELRFLFRKNRNLLNLLFEAASQTLLSWFYDQNHHENFKPGIIAALHTFGRDLKWNPHIHLLITEGATGNFSVWKTFNYFPYSMLRKRWQTTLLSLLENALGSSFKALKTSIFDHTQNGFYVHAKPNLSTSKAVSDYIIRYIGRPVMAQSRILNYDGDFITFWYERHEDNKRIEETIPVFEFIERLIIHIPNEQFKMLRYYGIYAHKHKNSDKLFFKMSPLKRKIRKQLSHWRERIELSFGYDPIKCNCGTCMKLFDIFCNKKIDNYLLT